MYKTRALEPVLARAILFDAKLVSQACWNHLRVLMFFGWGECFLFLYSEGDCYVVLFFQNVWLWDGKRHKDKKVNSRVVLTFIFYYCYMDRQRERGRISDFLDIRPFYIRTDTVYIWYKNWPDIRISFSHCSEDLLPLVKTSCHEKI